MKLPEIMHLPLHLFGSVSIPCPMCDYGEECVDCFDPSTILSYIVTATDSENNLSDPGINFGNTNCDFFTIGDGEGAIQPGASNHYLTLYDEYMIDDYRLFNSNSDN